MSSHQAGTCHTISQGKCTFSLSASAGVPWQKTWYHAENAALRRQREDPGILQPGDQLFVPEPERKSVPGNTEKRHRFVARRALVELRVVLREYGEPLARTPFHVRIGRQAIAGTTALTGADGLAVARVPAAAERALLVIGAGADDDLNDDDAEFEEIELIIGGVGPVNERNGQVTRLVNLDLLEADDDDGLPRAMGEFLETVQEGSVCPDKQVARLQAEYGS